MHVEFSEIFFNGGIWHGMRWCGILACWENWNKWLSLYMYRGYIFWYFLNYFSMEKCDVVWGDLLEFYNYFLMDKCDMACFLNLQNYFSIEKGDVVWGNFLKCLELFFNREMWHGMRWHGMQLEFSVSFSM
jgi:hypothetical protein